VGRRKRGGREAARSTSGGWGWGRFGGANARNGARLIISPPRADPLRSTMPGPHLFTPTGPDRLPGSTCDTTRFGQTATTENWRGRWGRNAADLHNPADAGINLDRTSRDQGERDSPSRSSADASAGLVARSVGRGGRSSCRPEGGDTLGRQKSRPPQPRTLQRPGPSFGPTAGLVRKGGLEGKRLPLRSSRRRGQHGRRKSSPLQQAVGFTVHVGGDGRKLLALGRAYGGGFICMRPSKDGPRGAGRQMEVVWRNRERARQARDDGNTMVALDDYSPFLPGSCTSQH